MERRRRLGRLRNLRHVPWLLAELLRAGPRIGRLEARLQELERRSAGMEDLVRRELRPILHALVSEEAENRRRLHRLREQPEYELAFTDQNPLVSVTVTTRDRAELLSARCLPSILEQDHERLEVIVVGDHAGRETAEAVASLGDERVIYRNLTQHLEPHEDPDRGWLVSATMARNEATRTVSGRWLVPLDDDDAMRPGHLSTLLEAAREGRHEVCYGRFRTYLSDGSSFDSGSFPPRRVELSWAAAIQHAGLRFFERELVAAALGLPGDWFLLDRMLRAGVRFGHVDRLVFDYYPSKG